MAGRLVAVGIVLSLASTACALDPKAAARREQEGQAAVLAAGAGAKLLATCGPFSADRAAVGGIPPDDKYVAFVERADASMLVRDPFILVANPPIQPDPDMVAVDAQGRPMPSSAVAANTILKSRTTSPGQSSFTALVWRVDANGGPVTEDRETFTVKKSPAGHKARAQVSINGKTTTFSAACS